MTKLEKIKSNEVSSGFVALLFVIMFFILAFILHFCPMVCDDREFLSLNYQNFTEAINYALHYGNGRFLGNLGAIILAPHMVLAALYKALTISLLGILLPLLFNAKKKVTYLLSFVLLLTIPSKMFAHVYAWNCGNVNYITPIVLLVICLMIIKSKITSNFDLLIKCLVLIIIGISQQLYVEHNAVVNVCIAVTFFIYSFCKKIDRKRLISVIWLISNLIGIYLLFFIPKLVGGYMVRDMSDYRQINLHSFAEVVSSLKENGISICSYLASLIFIVSIMMILCYSVLRQAQVKTKFGDFLVKVLKCFNVVCSLLSVFYTLIGSSIDLFSKSHRLLWIICIIASLEFFVFLLSTILFSRDRTSKLVGVLCLAVACSALAPLLIVNPIGWRNLFFAVTVVIFAVLFEFEKRLIKKNFEVTKILRSVLAVSIAVILTYLGIVMVDINDYYKQMINYVEDEIKDGKTKIQIFQIPNDYVHKKMMFEYEYYYKEPGDIEFEPVPYDVWEYNREKEKETQE